MKETRYIKCSKCNEEKPNSGFYARASGELRKECKVCARAIHKAWAERNKEKMKAYKQKYAGSPEAKTIKRERQGLEVNKAKHRAVCNSAYTKNPEKILARNRQWKKNNLAKHAAYRMFLRCTQKQRVPKWFSELDQFVVEEAQALRLIRNEVFGFKWHVDHEVPLRGRLVSGLHVYNNLRVIPASTNLEKNRKFVPGTDRVTGFF